MNGVVKPLENLAKYARDKEHLCREVGLDKMRENFCTLAWELERLINDIEASKKREDEAYAAVVWVAEDIKTLRPEWTTEQCDDWLSNNQGYIKDRLIELGWDVIAQLLPPKEG